MNTLRSSLTLGVFALLVIIAKCVVSNDNDKDAIFNWKAYILSKVGLTEKSLMESFQGSVKTWYRSLQKEEFMDAAEKRPDLSVFDGLRFENEGKVANLSKLSEKSARRLFLIIFRMALKEIVALKELNLTMDGLIAKVKDVRAMEEEIGANIMLNHVPSLDSSTFGDVKNGFDFEVWFVDYYLNITVPKEFEFKDEFWENLKYAVKVVDAEEEEAKKGKQN